ncbi:hypothetical protein PS662_00445 [Pseudomonas fluorescens]|uniref:Uncharacterized protein n=1 Tax=Pseudomonas fluorescens TaxID=294 RepID=A0A5E6PNQ4_PSEFL|nr:hypothetical protein PS662_00445 [Pseudomonas fluorescens]
MPTDSFVPYTWGTIGHAPGEHERMRTWSKFKTATGRPTLGLNQCLLTAGCLFQAVWNHQSGQPMAWGIKDYEKEARCL